MESVTLTIVDSKGTRKREMEAAFKVQFTPKLGTVVVIDLRISNIPPGPEIVATLSPDGLTIETSGSYHDWTLSDADGNSYTDRAQVFFLSKKAGAVLVHV